MFQEGLVNQAGSGGVVACRQGLNFTRGMFLECRHLSQTHSAQTSAVSSWNAGSDSPVQPLKCKIYHKKNKIKSLRNDVPNFFSKRQVLVFPHQDCIKFFFTKQTAKVSYFKKLKPTILFTVYNREFAPESRASRNYFVVLQSLRKFVEQTVSNLIFLQLSR